MTDARDRLVPALWALALAPLGALAMIVAYRFHPAVLLAAIAGGGAVGLAYLRPMWAVFVAVALVPLEVISVPVGATSITPFEIMLAVAGGMWALRRLVEGRAPWAASPLSLPLAVLLLCALPGFAVADDPEGVARFLVFWATFLLVFWLIVAEGDPASVKGLLLALALSGAVVGIIAEATSGEQELSATGGTATGRATGAFGSPNILASLLALALPGALYAAFGAERRRRGPAVVAAAFIFAGLTLTLSRAGLLAAGAAMLIMLAWTPLRRFAIVAVACFAVLLPFSSNQLGQVPEVNVLLKRVESVRYATSSRTDQRAQVYAETPRMIADHWLTGVGATNYPNFAPRYGIIEPYSNNTFVHAHNIALTIAAEFGLPGLAALIWLFAALVQTMVRACARGRPHRGAALAATAALVGVGVQGILDFTLRSNVIAASVFLMLGALAVLARSPGGADPRPAV